MNDVTPFETKTSKLGIDASETDGTPVQVEASIFSARPDLGSQSADGRIGDEIPTEEQEVVKLGGSAKNAKTQSRKRKRENISLGKVEDRAWLGALIVGEGSISVARKKGRKTCHPVLSIHMCDKSAIDKAARLMGVKTITTERVATSGRRTWTARVTCARALAVISSISPFLTTVKLRQAEAAVSVVRASGFKTRKEMRDERRLEVLKRLMDMQGGYTAWIAKASHCAQRDCLRHLQELEKEGLAVREEAGSASQPRLRWFPAQEDTPAQTHPFREFSVQRPGWQPPPEARPPDMTMIIDRNGRLVRKGWKGKRGGPLDLGDAKDRAWLAGLIVGEGTIYTWKARRSRIRIPRLAIRMLDREAIDRAGALMGVRTCEGGLSTTGRKFWIVQAVGGRAMEIVERVSSFLTPSKIRQADRAITRAKKTGFKSLPEKWESRKRAVERYVTQNPGCWTREIARNAGVSDRYEKILGELQVEGRLTRLELGSPRRRKTKWFSVPGQAS